MTILFIMLVSRARRDGVGQGGGTTDVRGVLVCFEGGNVILIGGSNPVVEFALQEA